MVQFSAVIDLSTLDGSNGFRLDGIDPFDGSGLSVGSAGDVNGDGFDDITIAAHSSNLNGDFDVGESYVVFGKASGFTGTLDLSALDGSNGFRLDGVDAYDISGSSVGSAGDVNGDGFDDIIVGAAGADPGGESFAGETYVVFGKATGFTATFSMSGLDGSNGFKLEGIDASDGSGRSVSSAGDVNGDGFDDIIIGAESADPGGKSNAGESYVVFGKATGFAATIDLSSLDGSDGFRLDGIDAEDRSGRSVSSAGDVNGDGFDDIIIGAEKPIPGNNVGPGESYVVFGKASGFAAAIDLSNLNGTSGFKLGGIDTYDESGKSVSSAGDVNGDGFDDIIIGAYGGGPGGNAAAGESYVVFGKSGGFSADFDLASLDGSNGFRLNGIDVHDFSGSSVSSAGDVNGDGFDDIIIGAKGADPGGDLSAGESYVVFGRATGFAAAIDLSGLDGSNGFRLDGIDAYDRSGESVSSAGDLNGDGFDDLIIGASSAVPNGNISAGESYVIFGIKETTTALNITGAAGDQTIQGGLLGDTILARGGDDAVFGHQGDDTLFGNNGNDELNGGTGADRLYGQDGDDVLNGNRGNDRLRGNDGNDQLFGLRNNDHMNGGAGDDLLDGGVGKDWLFGGTGVDTFVFAATYGTDSIHDWEDGIDQIDLTAFGFSDFNAEVLTNAAQSGADLVVTFGVDVLTINNLLLADFDAGDVLL